MLLLLLLCERLCANVLFFSFLVFLVLVLALVHGVF
jgi:hypothetical protein